MATGDLTIEERRLLNRVRYRLDELGLLLPVALACRGRCRDDRRIQRLRRELADLLDISLDALAPAEVRAAREKEQTHG